jgi:hypothetical protein
MQDLRARSSIIDLKAIGKIAVSIFSSYFLGIIDKNKFSIFRAGICPVNNFRNSGGKGEARYTNSY